MQILSRFRRFRGQMLSSLIVMAGYVLSRITGLLREIAISAQFGTSANLGAYRAAFKITDLLYMVIIGGALGSSFIPVFIQVWKKDSPQRAWRLASAVVTWAVVLLSIASMVVWLLAPMLTTLFYGGQGFDTMRLALTADLTRLFLLSPLLLGLGGLAMAALNAHEHFALPALAPAIYNIGIIGGAILLAPSLGVWGLAWGVVAGALFYLLIQLPGLWRMGMVFRPTLGRDIGELKVVARQMAPRVLGQAAAHLSLLVTAALTARLALGAERLTGLEYAYQLMLLPYGIFSLSLSTVAFPRLARLFAEQQHEELEQSVRRTLSMILFLTLPATVALISLSVPFTRLLFQRGEFDNISLGYTIVPLLFYATALPAFSVSEIFIRTFFAMQQTRIPVMVGIFQVLLNLGIGTLALSLGGGVGALAMAFSIANNVEAVLLFWLLGRERRTIWRNAQLWRNIRAALLATCLLAIGLWGVQHVAVIWLPFLQMQAPYVWQHDIALLLVWIMGIGMIGSLFYAGAAALFGAEEAALVWRKSVKILQRISSGATSDK